METVYELSGIQLKKGELQAEGLYMLFHPMSESCSVWFDKIEADVLMILTDNQFIEAACELLDLDADIIYGGWQLTDGSAATLQLGRKLSDTQWQYRQWVDTFDTEKEKVISLPIDVKFQNWDSHNWYEEIIQFKDYNFFEIKDAVETYGYTINDYKNDLSLFQLGDMDRNESIMIACECLFEIDA